MSTLAKRLLIVAFVSLCLFLGLGTWGAVKVVAWVKDLPNRIDIQIDSEGWAEYLAEGTRMTLREPDPGRQLETLAALSDGIATHPESIPWVQAELTTEIDALRTSPDPRVAAAAEALYAEIVVP